MVSFFELELRTDLEMIRWASGKEVALRAISFLVSNIVKGAGKMSNGERQRSGGVTALGVLNIVFGAFGVCGGMAAGMTVLISPALFRQMPGMATIYSEGPVRMWTVAGSVVGLAIGVFLIIAGVGLLKLRPWGRQMSIAYAVINIVWVIIGFVVNITIIGPQMRSMAEASQDRAVAASMIGGSIGATCGTIFGLAYPIVLLCCTFVKSIRDQFTPTGESTADMNA